jgi:hypothetical protein
VGIRTGSHRGAGKRALAGLAVLGVVIIAGLLAAWGVSPAGSIDISPADVVALRFPPDWMNDDATTGSAPATFALASATESRPVDPRPRQAEPHQLDTAMLFSPYQTFPMPSAATAAPQSNAASEPTQDVAQDPKSAPKHDAKPTVVATRAIVPAERRPAPRRKDSGELFNDAQLASIKTRLKLTEYQEQYWPPVASALRAIGWHASHGVRKATAYASETRLAEIDPDSAEVQQLKSAAFPLIMSMNDDQKQQVRMLAHVMGLEQVASSF